MCGEEENPCSGGAGTEILPSANNFAWNRYETVSGSK